MLNFFFQFLMISFYSFINYIIPFLMISMYFILVNTNKLLPNSLSLFKKNFTYMFFNFKKDMLGYYTFINNLFILLFLVNMLGLFPYIISLTTHISITLFMSSSMMMFCIFNSFYIKGLDFFADFTPENSPLWLAPLLALMETLSYMASIMSLGVRLAANILAGHMLMSMISNFVFLSLNFKFWIMPMLLLSIMLNIIMLLELLVSIMQSYIFCLLVCMYFEESFNMMLK